MEMHRENYGTLSRVDVLNKSLLQGIKAIYRLRKVGLNVLNSKPIYAYTVSIAKDSTYTLEERVKSFYNTLIQLLMPGEELLLDKKCFRIVCDAFEVYYCIEAWRKSADKMVYMEDGEVKVDLLHRMSCEQAAHIYKKLAVEPFELINTLDILQNYDNPADKYAALAKFPLLCTAAQAAIKNPCR